MTLLFATVISFRGSLSSGGRERWLGVCCRRWGFGFVVGDSRREFLGGKDERRQQRAGKTSLPVTNSVGGLNSSSGFVFPLLFLVLCGFSCRQPVSASYE